MHLSGLSQIIKLRGGVEKIGNKGGLYMFLEMSVAGRDGESIA